MALIIVVLVCVWNSDAETAVWAQYRSCVDGDGQKDGAQEYDQGWGDQVHHAECVLTTYCWYNVNFYELLLFESCIDSVW